MSHPFTVSHRRSAQNVAWKIAAGSWLVAGCLGAVASLTMSACEADGVTPNCPLDGGDCLTPPGDAYPVGSDAGAD